MHECDADSESQDLEERVMRILLMLFLILLFGLSLTIGGCNAGSGDGYADEPAGLKEAEHRDTTAMDSAALEAVPADTITTQYDSI
jgi:hypothetical protein